MLSAVDEYLFLLKILGTSVKVAHTPVRHVKVGPPLFWPPLAAGLNATGGHVHPTPPQEQLIKGAAADDSTPVGLQHPNRPNQISSICPFPRQSLGICGEPTRVRSLASPTAPIRIQLRRQSFECTQPTCSLSLFSCLDTCRFYVNVLSLLSCPVSLLLVTDLMAE